MRDQLAFLCLDGTSDRFGTIYCSVWSHIEIVASLFFSKMFGDKVWAQGCVSRSSAECKPAVPGIRIVPQKNKGQ